MFKQTLCALLIGSPLSFNAMAAISTPEVDHTNTIPNVIANALIVDGEGDDWTGGVLKIDLTMGEVHKDPDQNQDQVVLRALIGLWAWLPELQWDTWFGIPSDGSAGIAGGAGDLGGGPLNVGGTGIDAVSITWFNTAVGDTSPVQIGNISLTDDAAGTWEMFTSFANGQVRTSGPVINGVMVPEPVSLVLLSSCGLVLLRRRES